MKEHRRSSPFILLALSLLSIFLSVLSISTSPDASVMEDFKKFINPPASLGWTGPDPCNWNHVQCSTDQRVTRIQIGNQGLSGSLPPSLKTLTSLVVLEVQSNALTGAIPDLSGLTSIERIILRNNNFSSIPSDFFNGMSSLQEVYLDYNPFTSWMIPDSLLSASKLQTFSANSANIVGKIPSFFSTVNFSGLTNLHLGFNFLEGGLPPSLSGSSIQSLWLNAQQSNPKLTGLIDVLQNMTQLQEVWLHSNLFSGPLPDMSELKQLQNLNLRDNHLTGPVPISLLNLPSLKIVNLTNNFLQGPIPVFKSSVAVDMIKDTNSFCLPNPNLPCDPRVNILLSIAQSMGYPERFGWKWKGNNPCAGWSGITCSSESITVINFQNMSLSGSISPNFSSITSLQSLILSDNNLTGVIPNELTSLPNLRLLDVSNNLLYGKTPSFSSNVIVKTSGNTDIGKDRVTNAAPENRGDHKKKRIALIVGGGVCAVFIVGLLIFLFRQLNRKYSFVQKYPSFSGSDENTLMTVVGGGGCSSASDSGNMVIQIQVLKEVTNNFSEKNILGKGGFGTVYKGELRNGTKIAVKRMEAGVMDEKGLNEFKSEIAVLTQVRHMNLVRLYGYCFEGNERLLVYEYMPQGTLSRFLFSWKKEKLKPLDWTKRLIIALDVARAVEYLHRLAGQTFIHRDLKPCNILLGDDFRAKVADFGLVRHAPPGEESVHTSIAGTFGYLAPEYTDTGRITTKVDVYSFGVILMELITGRKASVGGDISLPLVLWFEQKRITSEFFKVGVDPTIDINNEDTRESINAVAELAVHCCLRDPNLRPEIDHVVHKLSSQADCWKPSDSDNKIDYAALVQAVTYWPHQDSTIGGASDNSFHRSMYSSNGSQTNTSATSSGNQDSYPSTHELYKIKAIY